MAVKKNATEAAEMEGKEKTVNNTMKDGKTDSGANNEATEGEKRQQPLKRRRKRRICRFPSRQQEPPRKETRYFRGAAQT